MDNYYDSVDTPPEPELLNNPKETKMENPNDTPNDNTVEPNDNTVEYIPMLCMICKAEPTPLHLNVDDVNRWNSGTLIQDVWPNQSSDWREMLITGIHPECWKELFA